MYLHTKRRLGGNEIYSKNTIRTIGYETVDAPIPRSRSMGCNSVAVVDRILLWVARSLSSGDGQILFLRGSSCIEKLSTGVRGPVLPPPATPIHGETMIRVGPPIATTRTQLLQAGCSQRAARSVPSPISPLIGTGYDSCALAQGPPSPMACPTRCRSMGCPWYCLAHPWSAVRFEST